jgi:hypothetical protein
MRYFCTYFDHRYLLQGLALYQSLRAQGGEFELWVLCLSQECLAMMTRLALPQVRLISLEEFERQDPALLLAKPGRSVVEYYFTCTPSLPLFVFARAPDASLVTYLDADLFFFAAPEPLFAEMGQRSIAIIGHRFPPRLKHLETTGIYNVGWVSFRRDTEGLACLGRWRGQCLDWCFDRVEPERFGDQKYLDNWPALYPGAIVLQHKGANLAPWNLENYHIGARGGRVMVDEQELIFFHFHGFKQLSKRIFDPHVADFRATVPRVVVRNIFLPYWRQLCRAAELAGSARGGVLLPEGLREAARQSGPAQPFPAWRKLRYRFRLLRGVLRRRYFVAW